MSSREQLVAFLSIVCAIVILTLAPVIASAILERSMPDALISMADKAVIGIVGVLGTIAGLIFRQNRVDEARAENTAKAFDAITAAQASTPAVAGPTGTPSDPVSVTEVSEKL